MFNVIVFDPRNWMTLTDISYLAVITSDVTLQCQKICVCNLGREALFVQDKRSQSNLKRTQTAHPQDLRVELFVDLSAIYADLLSLLIDHLLGSRFLEDNDEF